MIVPILLFNPQVTMGRNILNKCSLKSIISVWLDVSKSKIDICLLWNKEDLCLQIQNTKLWLIEFIEILKKDNFSPEIPLIVESTWDYNTLACILISEAWFNIIEINPIITKNYVKHTIRWTKTDKTDARALANIWILNKENLFSFKKDKKFIEISKKISLVSCLEKQIQALKRTLVSFYEVNNNLEISISSAVEIILISIQKLEKDTKNLQKEIEESKLKPESEKKVNIISSIKWISNYMAKVFYISFAHKDFISKESMYAFVWYDPKLKDSWNMTGKAYISKRWNCYVRKKLYQAAFCGIQHCKLFKDQYDKLKTKWKHHFTCVIVVIKKIIYTIYSLLKNNSMFDPNFGSF